jgi:hypothetical protein
MKFKIFNLSIKKLIAFVIVVGSFFFIDRLNFSFLSICHSNYVDEQVFVSEPTFISSGEIAFAKFFIQYRKPVGICTFPDGGTRLIVNKQIQLYTAQENGDYKLIGSKKFPKEVEWPTGFEVANLLADNRNLFFWVLSDGSANQKRIYYSLLLSSSKIELVNMEIESNLLDKDWNLNRFSTKDPSLLINYEPDMGIGLFSGGPLKFNLTHNQVVQGSSPKLEKMWLSKNILDSL